LDRDGFTRNYTRLHVEVCLRHARSSTRPRSSKPAFFCCLIAARRLEGSGMLSTSQMISYRSMLLTVLFACVGCGRTSLGQSNGGSDGLFPTVGSASTDSSSDEMSSSGDNAGESGSAASADPGAHGNASGSEPSDDDAFSSEATGSSVGDDASRSETSGDASSTEDGGPALYSVGDSGSGPGDGGEGGSKCQTSDDCSALLGPLPSVCLNQCPDGGDGCEHYVCLSGVCETTFCGTQPAAPTSECQIPNDCAALLGPLPGVCLDTCPDGKEGCEHYVCLSGVCQTTFCN
jgi:hypothetical protein